MSARRPTVPAPGPPRDLGERVYRRLLRLYPAAFQRDHGDEMVHFYRARRRELRTRHGLLAGPRLALEVGLDLLRSAPAERRRRHPLRPHGTAFSMSSLLSDIRFAVRTLLARPTFTLTVVGILTLGIGAGVGVFTLVDEVLLEPLPYPEPDRLVRIQQQNSAYTFGLSMADVLGIREQADSFEAFGVLARVELAARVEQRLELVTGGRIDAGLLTALRIDPALGRSLLPGDSLPGAEPVALVSWSLAERLFGDPEHAPGRDMALDEVPHTIVGVLPPGVRELAAVEGDLWPAITLEEPARRGPFGLTGIARLAPGVGLEAAAGELDTLSRRLFTRWADTFQDEEATLTPGTLRDTIVGDVRRPLLALLAAVAIVMLIALANVTNLVLARSTSRRRELGVRSALGAGAGRLGRLLLVEGGLLGGAGALAGVALAGAVVRLFVATAPRVPRLAEAGLDPRALALAGLLGVGAALVVASTSWLALRNPLRWLGGSTRGAGDAAASETVRGLLVISEFALALPLLAGAGLLVASLLNLANVPLGFEPDRIVAARVQLPEASYADPAEVFRYWQEAPERLAAVAGVEAVGLLTGLPPDSPRWTNNFDLADRPVEPGEPQPVAPWSQSAPGALEALGVPLLEGRGFEPGDDFGSRSVALVSESWARRHYGDESPIGREMYAGGCTPDSCGSITVVGVVGDVKFAGLERSSEAVYTPLAQEPSRSFWLLVRTDGPPAARVPALDEALRSVDSTLPPSSWTTLGERVDRALATPRAWTLLLGGFASVAVLLAAVGIFGVLSYLVGRRRPEIGIRMALGADSGRVQRMVVGAGLRRTSVGIGVGLALTFWLDRTIESLLFGVAPGDPAIMVGTVASLLAISAIACWMPARRAGRTDAAEVMRAD